MLRKTDYQSDNLLDVNSLALRNILTGWEVIYGVYIPSRIESLAKRYLHVTHLPSVTLMFDTVTEVGVFRYSFRLTGQELGAAPSVAGNGDAMQPAVYIAARLSEFLFRFTF